MTKHTEHLDKEFVAAQKQRLLTLQDELQRALDSASNDASGLQSSAGGEAHEYEDDAQKLAGLEIDAQLADQTRGRLTAVRHALRKIDDGTYGISDISGKHISEERLRALPEAATNVDEA